MYRVIATATDRNHNYREGIVVEMMIHKEKAKVDKHLTKLRKQQVERYGEGNERWHYTYEILNG